ncbi:MAG: YceI family protein [Cyclobacteriaceae bacterium]|nr:YceI family protein [Cyclobacteriaceae bacterium]
MKNLISTVMLLTMITLLSAFTSNVTDGTFTVDSGASQVKWTGYHLAKSYEHNGFVKIKSGKFSVSDGKLTAGEFVIDMNTISNSDVTDAKDNAKLVNHLKSDDFFGVKKFPEAKLLIKGSEPTASGLRVTADLTIRGITKSILFDATLKEADGGKVEATATITVQRTDFEVMYGWKVSNAMLSGEFKMDVKLVGVKS